MSNEGFEYGRDFAENHSDSSAVQKTEADANAGTYSASSADNSGAYNAEPAGGRSAGSYTSASAGTYYSGSSSDGYNYDGSSADPSSAGGYHYSGSYNNSANNTYSDSYNNSANNTYSDSYNNSANNTYSDSYNNSASNTYSGSNEKSENSGSADSAGNGRYYSYERSGSPAVPPVPPRRENNKKKGRGRLAVVLAVILVFVLGAGAGALMSGRSASASLSGSSSSAKSSIESGTNENSGETEDDSTGSVSGTVSGGNTISRVEDSTGEESLADTSVADVAEKVMPAIVSVYNKYTEESQFFGRTYTQEAESAGSGIIIEETDSELLIVTNNHVVEGADSLSVQFINEENCEAALKGTDTSSDLAVISVSLDALSAGTKESIAVAELGDSDTLRIGERAIAIGNALGYGQSLTVGYISALNREITSEDGITGTFIQTDAAINPGNSGGALLNSTGQVIGINSNKIGGDAIEGMGFAIPISKAIPIIDGLKTQESKTKVAEEDQGVLGVYGISVTSDVASAYNLPVGAYIEEIIEGSGAAQSDLQQGDIITAINGQTITGMEDLQNQLAYYSAGEEVTLTVQHPLEGGEYEEREIKVTLTKRSEMDASTENREDQTGRTEQSQGYEEFGQENGIFSFPFGF